jgi:hypothetical protein
VRDAGVMGMHAAESDEQTDPILPGANRVNIRIPELIVTDQGPLCNIPLL